MNIFYLFFNYILELLHDYFRVPISHIERLKTIIKYIYLFYFFNPFFHRKKVGITFFEGKLIIELKSKSYDKYKDYLPSYEMTDIYKYTFESKLATNKDIESEVKHLKLKSYSFTDE